MPTCDPFLQTPGVGWRALARPMPGYHPLHLRMSLLLLFTCTANKMHRGHRQQHLVETANHGRGVYAQPKLPPDKYVGDFDEVPLGLPGSAPCSLRTCCCCLNVGEFETIRTREEPSRSPCCPASRRKASNPTGKHGVGRGTNLRWACSSVRIS